MQIRKLYCATQVACTRKGSILVIVLLIMVALSVFGVLGIQLSLIEMKLVGNERDIRETFYLSEGAVLEGVQRLVNLKQTDLLDAYPVWHHSRKKLEALQCNFRNVKHWSADTKEKDNCIHSRFNPEGMIAAVEWNVASGGSLIMTEAQLMVTRIYGLCRKHNTDQLIEIGYAMRY